MTVLAALIAPAILGGVLWMMSRRAGPRPGPANNWRNEDYMSRESDGTWAEGSSYSKTQPTHSTGIRVS